MECCVVYQFLPRMVFIFNIIPKPKYTETKYFLSY